MIARSPAPPTRLPHRLSTVAGRKPARPHPWGHPYPSPGCEVHVPRCTHLSDRPDEVLRPQQSTPFLPTPLTPHFKHEHGCGNADVERFYLPGHGHAD